MKKVLAEPLAAVQRGIPALQWLPLYDTEKGISDLVAGITVGLTLIPQSIAYAALAGLGPEYGLYASLCGGIIYAIFGTIPELNIAPTAILSLLTYTYTHESPAGNINACILLCFLGGTIELVCGILHLGFLVDFVSTPVVAAFTSAGAITIASAQFKNLLGLKFSAETFSDVMKNVVQHIGETKMWDAVLGASCCIFLVSLRQIKDFGSPPLEKLVKGESIHKLRFKKFVWFLSTSRNALVVVACAVLAFCLESHGMHPFSLTTKVPAGLPMVSLPPFQVTTGNTTFTFLEISRDIGSGILVVPFVSILGNVAIAKAFAHGKVVDASQEMAAVGMCNIVSSFFSSFPINASFSRAAVSNASGVRTPLGGIYTTTMVILALTFLTPYFSFIPKATLAAVIVCAVLFMVEVVITKTIWNVHKLDLVPFLVTFVACLVLGMEVGILIGVVIDVLLLLYYSARPKLLMESLTTDDGLEYVRITPTSPILYPSAEYIREKVMQCNVEAGKNPKVFVFDCRKMNRADFTAAKCIGALVSDLKKTGKSVVFYGLERTAAEVITGTCRKDCSCLDSEEEVKDYLKSFREQYLNNVAMDAERLGSTKL